MCYVILHVQTSLNCEASRASKTNARWSIRNNVYLIVTSYIDQTSNFFRYKYNENNAHKRRVSGENNEAASQRYLVAFHRYRKIIVICIVSILDKLQIEDMVINFNYIY